MRSWKVDIDAGAPADRKSDQSRRRRDKVTGRAQYTADTTVESLTSAALLQSEIAHGVGTAETLRVSAAKVAGAPGVLFVLTPLNCPALQLLPRDLLYNMRLERRPPLRGDHVEASDQAPSIGQGVRGR